MLKLGSKGAAVRSIQEILIFLGYAARDPATGATLTGDKAFIADGVFGPVTEGVVSDFQENEAILADGIVGPQTMRVLEKAYTERRLELDSPGEDAFSPTVDRFSLVPKPADLWGEGYTKVRLRSDVAEAYTRVREITHRHGALLTSSGGIRSLSANVSAGRSATSFHYSGRALDLFIWSGMVDKKTDPYVMERVEDRQFRVWARCFPDREGATDIPEERKITKVVTYEDRHGRGRVKGHFIDLTALLEAEGFHPIQARRNFIEGGSRIGAEWWHFQNETGLVEGHSTFGAELLKIYRRATVEPTPPWASRDRVFGIDWV